MSGVHQKQPSGAVDATQLVDRARSLQPQAEAFLESLVRIETPSPDRAAQQPALDMLERAFAELGMTCRRFGGRRSGGTLIARWPSAVPRPVQLLIGHCDTVWPHGTLETMPLRREGDLLYGPGVFDMKAGLTQTLFALRCLRELGYEPTVRPVVLINSDEEVGTHDTYRTLERLAALADRALVAEPSLAPDGRLKSARKGVAQYQVTVHGRPAHAGLNPEEGISAVLEMSHIVQQLHALNDPESGVTVNVGTVEGGSRPNVVAAQCSAAVDVRVPTHDHGERIRQAFAALETQNPDARIEVEFQEGRRPMEFTEGGQRLWAAADSLAASMGFELGHGRAGGGSDGNITNQFTPTLDGLGAVGDGAHSPNEHVDLSHMAQRTALLAGLILHPELVDK